MIQRHERPRDMERPVVGRRTSRGEAQALRSHRHGRKDGYRVHLHDANAVSNRFPMIRSIDIRHCQPIIEESQMKLPVLERSGDPPIICRGHEVTRRFCMPPGCWIIRAILRLQKPHHDDFPVRHHASFRHHCSQNAVSPAPSFNLNQSRKQKTERRCDKWASSTASMWW